MICKDKMMDPMLDACPSFEPTWTEFLVEWSGESCDLPHYLALSDLARHLIDMLQRGDTASFPKIFEVVERWHLEGEHYVREAATVGLLEDLQNTNLHDATDPDQFLPYLEAESKKWWYKLIGFWERGELLTED